MTDRPRNRRGEGTRLRTEIVDAATALIEESGSISALTLRAVARRAGVSAPSIYAHFSDLDTIAAAVLARTFDELTATIATAASTADDPVDRVLAIGFAYVRFGQAHPARYRFMFAADGYSPDAVRAYEIMREAIVDCIEAGRSSSTDPHLDTWLVWAALHGVATLEKPGRPELLRLGTLDRPRLLTTMIERLARVTP